MDSQQPGQIITPQQDPQPQTAIPQQPSEQPPVQEAAQPATQQPQPQGVAPQPVSNIVNLPQAHAQPVQDSNVLTQPTPGPIPTPAVAPTQDEALVAAPAEPTASEGAELSWTASESIEHEKNATWFGLYIVGTVLLGAAVYFATKDVVSSVVVFVATFGLLFVVARKPQEQTYRVNEDQFAIGRRVYSMHDFQAFSIDDSTQTQGMTLWPLKRFLPPVTLHLPVGREQQVTDHFAAYLPVQPHKVDALDVMLRRLHL